MHFLNSETNFVCFLFIFKSSVNSLADRLLEIYRIWILKPNMANTEQPPNAPLPPPTKQKKKNNTSQKNATTIAAAKTNDQPNTESLAVL